MQGRKTNRALTDRQTLLQRMVIIYILEFHDNQFIWIYYISTPNQQTVKSKLIYVCKKKEDFPGFYCVFFF